MCVGIARFLIPKAWKALLVCFGVVGGVFVGCYANYRLYICCILMGKCIIVFLYGFSLKN